MEKILIAKVLKPQGLKGELKCKLENDDYSIIQNVNEIYLADKDVPCRIKEKAYRGGYWYITIGTINSREKADLIRGFKIFADKKFLTVPEDQYMIDDILGSVVYSEDGCEIGKLIDVQNYGATDLFVIQQYGREYMVPFVKDIILNVNPKLKTIIVNKSKYDEAKICD